MIQHAVRAPQTLPAIAGLSSDRLCWFSFWMGQQSFGGCRCMASSAHLGGWPSSASRTAVATFGLRRVAVVMAGVMCSTARSTNQ